MAGFDGIVIKGKADNPCYLLIENGELKILEGKDLWGKGVFETTIILKDRHGKSKVAAIGPAGENLVRFASIMNDNHRAIGRGGVGAVMGSKNLKAIVVKGKQPIPIAEPKYFSLLSQQGGKKAVANAPAFAKYGTSLVFELMNEKGTLPTRNFTAGQFEGASSISGEALKKNFFLRDKGCFHCPLRCANINQVKSGPYWVEETEGPEYETLMAFGSNCGNSNLASIIKANDLCNDLGLDTISTGCTIALMMDLFQRRIISTKETDGIQLTWGNHNAIVELIPKIAVRKGFGNLLAEGSFRAAEELGERVVERVIHCKGQEFPGYEIRRAYGTGLSFATGNRGACHLRAQMYVHEIFKGEINPIGFEGKIELLKAKEDLMAFVDSLVMCKFGWRNGEFTPAIFAEVLKVLIGVNYTEESLLQIGERIWNMERLYNLREKEIEDVLPDRFFQEDLEDSLKNGERISLKDFEEARAEYYRLRGWDEIGRPYSETLKNLGLSSDQKS
jgi:aldehyde:ferredoxin oxidoreductase